MAKGTIFRLNEQYVELMESLSELEAFIVSGRAKDMDPHHIDLLLKQREAMKQYALILQERIYLLS